MLEDHGFVYRIYKELDKSGLFPPGMRRLDVERQPPYWLLVDEEYFGKDGMRAVAYRKHPDPYKDQKRPVTQLMEMEDAMKARELELRQRQADIDRLVREKAKQ